MLPDRLSYDHRYCEMLDGGVGASRELGEISAKHSYSGIWAFCSKQPLGSTLRAKRPGSSQVLTMYDDASFYNYIPSAQEDRSAAPKHKRKQSLLKQPHVSPNSSYRSSCI